MHELARVDCSKAFLTQLFLACAVPQGFSALALPFSSRPSMLFALSFLHLFGLIQIVVFEQFSIDRIRFSFLAQFDNT